MAAAIVAALAAASAGVMPADAAVQDTEGPLILSAWTSQQRIDVVDGPVQLTVRIEVQDLGSGLAKAPFLDPMSMGYGYSFDSLDAIPGKVMTLISGDSFQGLYETTFTFPEHVSGGNWILVPNVFDRAGNRHNSDSIGIIPTVVSVEDNDAPTVTGSISASVVDISDGPAKVVVTVRAYDEGIGIPADASTELGGRAVRNSSTDPHQATFKTTFDYPEYVMLAIYEARSRIASAQSLTPMSIAPMAAVSAQ